MLGEELRPSEGLACIPVGAFSSIELISSQVTLSCVALTEASSTDFL